MTEGLTLSLSLSVGKFCMTHGMAKKKINNNHIHIYSLILLEARSLKSVLLDQHQDGGSPTFTPEALEESPFLVLPASVGVSISWLVATSLQYLPPSSHRYVCVCECVCVCLPLPVHLIRIDMIAFRAHLDNIG